MPIEFALAVETGLSYFFMQRDSPDIFRGLDSSRRLILLPTPPPSTLLLHLLCPLFLTLIFITVVKLDLLAPRQRFL